MLCVSAPLREKPPLTNTINNLVLYPKQSSSMLCVSAPLREKPPLTNTINNLVLYPKQSSSMLCAFAPLRETPSHQNTMAHTSKSRIPIIIKALRLCVKKPRILFLYPKQSPSRLCALAPLRENISHQYNK